MQKFFQANLGPPSSKIVIGESSLSGMYACNYCGEACAQLARFQVWVTQNKEWLGKGSFCTPECSMAYVTHRCSNVEQVDIARMKMMIEKKARRLVNEAPPPSALFRYNKVNGLKREQWLCACRSGLDEQQGHVADRELFIQKLDTDAETVTKASGS